MSILEFQRPEFLILLVLIAPTFLLAWLSRSGQSAAGVATSFGIRTLLLVLLAGVLAEPTWVRTSEDVTVTVILDRSLSVPTRLQRDGVDFVRSAVPNDRRPDDRVALITVARDAEINALPTASDDVEVLLDPADRTATDLSAAVRLALATMPDDTANRIVLVSDGNETLGSVREAAELARANGVPVDVVPLDYEAGREVIVEELVAPARGRIGQTARIRTVLRSQGEASGVLRMSVNGTPLDLNGADPGTGRRLVLEPGMNAVEELVSLDRSGPYRFEAFFDPDDDAGDVVDRNNEAIAVTFVGGGGRVLVADNSSGADSADLERALIEAGIEVDRFAPSQWVGGIGFLSSYDAVILVNMPIHALERGQDDMLYAYVHDLGGGLVMVGGDQSFGAGGWIDSATAETLPLDLNPRQERQMMAGALALIMHSCEMPQANFWGQLVAESAIEALSRLDYCGIIEFQWNAGPNALQGNGWAFPMQRLGDKKGALAATRQMQIGDMPSFDPSFTLAHQGLINVPAAQRHTIVISDGDPSQPLPGTLNKFVRDGISCTTVMVGGHGTAQDRARMQMIANQTGGTFYQISDPNQLPQIFFKEATMISRSLIQDGQRFPVAVRPSPTGPLGGFRAVPAVDGFVLTEERPGLADIPLYISTEDGNDPLYAHWNFGLGRTVAYTSGVTERWGGPWLAWGEFRAFWEQTVRWAMRPSAPVDLQVQTRIEGETAIVEMEASDADAGSLNFLRTDAVVIGPDNQPQPLALSQVGPGQYRGTFPVDRAGAFLVNIRHEQPGPDGAPAIGTVQSAVTVPFSREFRTVASDQALLRGLAEQTGGRVIRADSPELADLFDRETLAEPRSPKPIWDLLAIIAAALMVIDVAARRIAVDIARLRTRIAAMFGSRDGSDATGVEAMRRARATAATARGETGASAADVPVADPSVAARRFTADDDAAGDGRGLDLETGGGGPAKPGGPERPAVEEDESAMDRDDYTSRLLAARRRARGSGDGDGKDPGGTGGDA